MPVILATAPVGGRRGLPLRALLRFLLVPALVPVLVIAGTEMAVADGMTVGPTLSFSVGVSNGNPTAGNDVDCNFTARWETLPGIGPGAVAPSSRIRSHASCSRGFNIDEVTVGVMYPPVEGVEGQCSNNVATFNTFDSEDGDDSATSELVTGDVVGGVPVAASCEVVEACASFLVNYYVDLPGEEDFFEECVPLALGDPPAPWVAEGPGPPGEGCPQFDGVTPVLTLDNQYPNTAGYVASVSNIGPSVDEANHGYLVMFWMENVSGSTYLGQPAGSLKGYDGSPSGSATVSASGTSSSDWVVYFEPDDALELRGIQLVSVDRTELPPGYSTVGYKELRTAIGSPNALGGATYPDGCSWYWGDEIAVDPPSTIVTNVPVGPISTGGGGPPPDDPPDSDPPGEPEPESGGCGFSFTDPSTWAGAGICQLVKAIGALVNIMRSAVGILGDVLSALVGGFDDLLDVLGDVLGALQNLLGDVIELLEDVFGALADLAGDIVSGVVGGISSLLSTLFIPSNDWLDGAFADSQATVDASAVGDWKAQWEGAMEPSGGGGEGFGEGGLPSSIGGTSLGEGGCEGPSFTWDKFTMVGLPATVHPVDACSGTSATLAHWSHLLLTIMVAVGAAAKCLEIIMVSVGAMKQTNVLISHDWSGAVKR